MAAVLALRAQVEEQRCYATDFQADENNINALPREMLVRIMRELPVGCAATLASVCQTWHRATEDSGLWRYLCMDDWARTIRWSVVDEVRARWFLFASPCLPVIKTNRGPCAPVDSPRSSRSRRTSWRSMAGSGCIARSASSANPRLS